MTLLQAAGMMVALALPVAACAPALIRLLESGPRWPDRLLAVSLSFGGLGLASLPIFFWVTIRGRMSGPFAAADAALLVALTGASAYLARRLRPMAAEGPAPSWPGGVAPWVALAALIAVAAAAMWGAAIQAERYPHGQWDAWATWNLRARFLRRAGDWHAALRMDPPMSHADYPMLLPASVARLWAYAGTETGLAPAALAFLFTFASAALCGAALWRLRGGAAAVAATALLLANSDFVVHGQSQYADVPAGYFLLAALVLLAWHDEVPRPTARPWALFLAGLAAGLGAWTKNEGLVAAAAILATRAALAASRRDWARLRVEMAWLGAGLALPLASVAIYKSEVSYRNWLLQGQPASLLELVLDWNRFRAVLEEFGRRLLGFGWGAVPGAAAVALVLARAGRRHHRAPLWPLAALGLVMIGYALALLASPLDLRWLLDWTVSRLLCQVWPAALFALFLAAAPSAAVPSPPATPPSRA